MEVFFELDKEVVSFCESVFRRNRKMELNWKTNEDWGNHLTIDEILPAEDLRKTISNAMTDVVLTHRLGNMIRKMINEYYYTEQEEIERIHDLTNWILTGEDEDSKHLRNNKDIHGLLTKLFEENIEFNSEIHFDSLVNFRLLPFRDEIRRSVGDAIDEFRREEDHQAFIDMLRAYIQKKDVGMEIIHIMQGDTFQFYYDNGKQLSRLELRMLMREEPLYVVGLHDNEFNLAPLIAMGPKKIKIYGDDPSEPKTLTVINIFQEKVDFEPTRNFPFSYYLKND
ncbi:putative sporulation protein YtxC [Oceanobacillus iheyensis]|uniref:putative sporulation protein YtxC n=1 Tax=Oceanobacillus iheyensis TaxID=182710 RepID=UPI003629F718